MITLINPYRVFMAWFPDNPGMYTRPEDLSILRYCATYVSSVIYLLFGWLHRYVVRYLSKEFDIEPKTPEGYAPLFDDFGAFYSRYLFGRICDCWNRPICSTPGAYIDVMERNGSNYRKLKTTGRTKKCLNLGSYNYLGFAENSGNCTKSVIESIKQNSISTCASRLAFGTSDVHRELEALVAKFLGKEDAIVFGMGYATNSTTLPGIISGKDCLIISDANNHASLVSGMRRSGAVVRQFRHNDTAHLEEMLREAILQGQASGRRGEAKDVLSKERKPWKKILIVVEGIYSMEGEILPLPEIVRIKKKYNAYIYIDEAHSIGALGNKGGGVCDYYGVPTSDIDILMGTFTKSFGSAGGYIAGTKQLIRQITVNSFASVYDTSMSVPCTMQVISSLKSIMGLDGTDEGQTRLRSLQNNTNYFRKRMKELGFRVLGNEDSPVVPVLIHLPSAMTAFCRMCQDNGIGCVVASYPATPIFLCRARFCISASHTIEGLEVAIKNMSKLGDICGIRYDLHKVSRNDPNPATSATTVNGKYHSENGKVADGTHKNGYANGKVDLKSNGFH